MKTFATFAWALLVVMMVGFTSCGDDNNGPSFTPEQEAYMKKNLEFFEMKKTEKAENGELKYNQVVLDGQVALYRIIKKENNYTAFPNMNTVVEIHNMEGKLIDGTVFQKNIEKTNFTVNQLIPGMAIILTKLHADETVEAIIPASLGYGDRAMATVPAGSTLIFTFTLFNF